MTYCANTPAATTPTAALAAQALCDRRSRSVLSSLPDRGSWHRNPVLIRLAAASVMQLSTTYVTRPHEPATTAVDAHAQLR